MGGDREAMRNRKAFGAPWSAQPDTYFGSTPAPLNVTGRPWNRMRRIWRGLSGIDFAADGTAWFTVVHFGSVVRSRESSDPPDETEG